MSSAVSAALQAQLKSGARAIGERGVGALEELEDELAPTFRRAGAKLTRLSAGTLAKSIAEGAKKSAKSLGEKGLPERWFWIGPRKKPTTAQKYAAHFREVGQDLLEGIAEAEEPIANIISNSILGSSSSRPRNNNNNSSGGGVYKRPHLDDYTNAI